MYHVAITSVWCLCICMRTNCEIIIIHCSDFTIQKKIVSQYSVQHAQIMSLLFHTGFLPLFFHFRFHFPFFLLPCAVYTLVANLTKPQTSNALTANTYMHRWIECVYSPTNHSCWPHDERIDRRSKRQC